LERWAALISVSFAVHQSQFVNRVIYNDLPFFKLRASRWEVYRMGRKADPSDDSDVEWVLVAPYLFLMNEDALQGAMALN
jgi:hypothetical protein